MFNTAVRNKILEVLDNNSKDIPEGVYLQLCNLLKKFKIEEKIEEKNEDLIISFVRRGDRLVEEERIAVVAERTEATRKILNPATGRMVSIHGKIGRRLINQ